MVMVGRVRQVEKGRAVMEDGRKVRLAPSLTVRVHEYLEVYADMALGKIAPSEARRIIKAQKRGN